MHVLFDARLLHRPMSGLERVQRNLARELSRRPEIGRLQVAVMAGTRPPPELASRAEIVEVHGTEDLLARLLAPVPADRPDVYHLSFFPDRSPRDLLLLPAAKAAVVEVHDAILNRHPEYHPSRANWHWYHDFVKLLVAQADRLLVHSPSVAREVEADLGGRVDRCDIAPLAVDPSLLGPVDRTARARLRDVHRLEGDYFVALGKDYPHKDHATLFRALARLPRSIRLIIAGEKVWHGGQETDALVRRLNLGERVTWIGGLSDEEVKALLEDSRGLVYPSLEEGFGLPPIEAMLRGIPVLASDAMAIPDVCGDGAWMFPPGDADALHELMQRVLAGGEAVNTLIARGRARAATFSWSRSGDAVLTCYRNAIDASAARPDRIAGIVALLTNIAACPHQEARELADWRARCLGVEHQLRDVVAARDDVVHELRRLQAELGRPLMPHPTPRSRWSLRRRIGKIRRVLGW